MSIPGYTEQELASLTPDERSALESESATDDDAEVLAALAAEGDDGADADADVAAQAEAQAAADAAASAEAGDRAASTDDDDEAKPEEETAAVQVDKTFRAELPADIAEKRKALRAEDSAALKKLMDGEIEAEAYAEIRDRISDELEALVRAETTADVSTKLAAQAKANEWERQLKAAVANAKVAGLDYMGNPELASEFDSLLKLYSDKAAQKGLSDDNLEASTWALAEANKMMRKMHGTPAKAAPAVDKKDAAPAAARHNLTTLTNIPAADRAPIADDVMSKVGSLQGEDLEKYMATLSSREIDRIMAGT